MFWNAIIAFLGIVSTLIAYLLNPQKRKDDYRQRVIKIYRQLENLERERDEALRKNDIDKLSIVTNDIIRLRKDKTNILQLLGED